MLIPRLDHVTCSHPQGQHRMAWWSWGHPQASHVVVCVHGLTRQGRDFDRLARVLVERSGGLVQVVCPDVAGRGQSDWLPRGDSYHLAQYVSDMLIFLTALQQRQPIATLDWIGTSMGGLIGMVLAGQPGLPLPAPIRRLVLNDVGPSVTWSSVKSMQTYVGRYGRYANLAQAASYLREVSQGFGPVPEDVWLELSTPMVRLHPEGGVTLHYDPAIGEPVRAMDAQTLEAAEAMLWGMYDQIQAQVLLVRGQASELLTHEVAQTMTKRGPCAQLLQWAGVGHAPTLAMPEQMAPLVEFLLGADA